MKDGIQCAEKSCAINETPCIKNCGRTTKNSQGVCADCMRAEATEYFVAVKMIKGGENSGDAKKELF